MDPSDGDRSLSLHLARGVLAAAALWAAFHFYAVIGWPALLLIAVTLWMLSTNDRARRFYLRQGWSQLSGQRTQEFGGQVVTDHRFGRTLVTGGNPPAQIFSRPSQ